MIIWVILGVLTVAGLCYGSYRYGRTGHFGPGRLQRKPQFIDNLSRTEPLPRPPAPRLVKPIHHQPVQTPPVVVTHRIGQGVTAGYFRSRTDPQSEIVTAVYYDGSHADKDIPAGTYIVDTEKQRYYSREEFLKEYAPAEVGVVMTPEVIWPEEATRREKTAHSMAHAAPFNLEPAETELEKQMFEQAAAEFDFPTAPKTYSGACEHSIAREQLKKSKLPYQGMGHFVPCRECGQKFEFRAEPEQQAALA